MADLSTDELTRDGEHGRCETCGESFHWEQLTNTEDGAYCDEHLPRGPEPDYEQIIEDRARDRGPDPEAVMWGGEDFGHDSAVDRGLGEGIGR